MTENGYSETGALAARRGKHYRLSTLAAFAALLLMALCLFCARGAMAEGDDANDNPEADFEFYTNDEYEYGSDGKTVKIYSYHGTDTDVTIPATLDGLPVTAIGGYLLYGNMDVGALRIPEGVTSIDGESFVENHCPLTVYLPKSLTSIDTYVFSFSDNLTLVIDKDNPAFVFENGALLSRDGTRLLDYLDSDARAYEIPAGVKRIEDWAFWWREKLTQITIPDSVTSIGYEAFCKCEALKALTLPDSVTDIGEGAFSDCKSLTSMTVPNRVWNIQASTFAQCEKLTSVVLPEGVTTIGEGAFQSCEKLTDIVLPAGVTSIGDSAFRTCSALKNLEIPAGVTELGPRAFRECDLLTLTIAPENTRYRIVDGVLYNGALTELLTALPAMAVGKVTVAAGITKISDNAFVGCNKMTGVVLPERLTSIGFRAFEKCSKLTYVSLPESLTEIEKQAFNACTALKCIRIPGSVHDLPSNLFSGCTSLMSVALGQGVMTIGERAFDDLPKLTNVVLPASLIKITLPNFEKCGKLTVYASDDVFVKGLREQGIKVQEIDPCIEGAVLDIGGNAVPAFAVVLENDSKLTGADAKAMQGSWQAVEGNPPVLYGAVPNCRGIQIQLRAGTLKCERPYTEQHWRLSARLSNGKWTNGDAQTPVTIMPGDNTTLTLLFTKPTTLEAWTYEPAEDTNGDWRMQNVQISPPTLFFSTVKDAEAYLAYDPRTAPTSGKT